MTPPAETFRKREHLLKTADFRNVYKKCPPPVGKRGGVVLYRLPNGLPYTRIGFSIGSRNVKLASSRNRVRRLFREIFRRRKKELKRGFDIILVVKRDFGKAFSFKDAEDLFFKLAKDTGIAA